MVFASRHGELARTLTMLRDLAKGEDLSPTAFSLSVHNAAAGVYSIARGDHAPATAISAGEETFAFAMLEASSRLSTTCGRVLLVYADDPIPEEYRAYVATPEVPHAVALLISNMGPTNIDAAAGTQPPSSAGESPRTGEMMPLTFLRLLAGDAEMAAWFGERTSWTWRKRNG